MLQMLFYVVVDIKVMWQKLKVYKTMIQIEEKQNTRKEKKADNKCYFYNFLYYSSTIKL